MCADHSNATFETDLALGQQNWEHKSCVWCGSEEYHVIFEGPDRLERLPGVFKLVCCEQCGVYRQNPQLSWDSLKAYYPEDYVGYDYNNYDDEKTYRSLIRRYGNWKRKRSIERFISNGKLLEVGCGSGGFLSEMAFSKRWDLTGIEPNQKAADYTQRRLGVPVHQGLFSSVDLEQESFDVIAFWCVLEHLKEPINDLRYAHCLLKPDGIMVFALPNRESLGAKVFGRYWAGWDLPRHLTIFPRSTLYQILEEIGFIVVSEQCIASGYATLGHSIDFWSQDWESRYPKLKQMLMKLYNTWFVRLVLALPLAIIGHLKLSTNITIIAKKV